MAARPLPPADRTLVDAALAYAATGWPVFPCNSEKRPLTKHGFEDAAVDLSKIEDWWCVWPDAMIGVPTGPVIGAWVLDVDHPGLFEAACEIALPATRRSNTGKGYHLFFAWDEAKPVRNAQRSPHGWPFPDLPGVEVRGEGGYVIVPPSVHPSGRRYEWFADEDSSEAPDELIRLITQRQHQPVQPAPAAVDLRPCADTPYGLAALRSESAAIAAAPDGAQEKALNDGALKLGSLVGGGALTFETAAADLLHVGLGITSHNPRNPWTAKVITSKIHRALRDGARSPRTPAPRLLRSVVSEQETARRADRPVIAIRAGELDLMAEQAEAALIGAEASIFVRGGLVRPVVREVAASRGYRTNVAKLDQVDACRMIYELTRVATWTKYNARKKAEVAADPPLPLAQTILARDGEWKFPNLTGVITAPTLRPDGTILAKPGYDAETQLFLMGLPPLPAITDRPSRADAEGALRDLDTLLQDFPFVGDASRSVALSALITPVARGAMEVAPLHATTAPVAGSGKSYIIDLASAIGLGQRAPVIAAGRTEEETEKRLDAALLAGQAIVSIDNVNGELGGDKLCQAVERPSIQIRPLGLSKLLTIENRATLFATGNNIRMVGDMTRRVILCSLDPQMERPEQRVFRSDPFGAVLADRGKYIASALTIVRAYASVGFPDQLAPLASFEEWSRLVRSALVWLGRADPVETMERARADDPVLTSLQAVLCAWDDAVGGSGHTAGDIKVVAERRDSFGNRVYEALSAALIDAAEGRGGEIDARRLGHFLGRHQNRVVSGLKLVAADHSHAKQKLWKVVRQD